MAGPQLKQTPFSSQKRKNRKSLSFRPKFPSLSVDQPHCIWRSSKDKKCPQLSLESMSVEVFLQQIVAHLQTFDPPFFPLKLQPELLHQTCKCRLCWYRPHFNVPSHNHRDDRIHNWPFSSSNAFGTLFTLFAAGCKTTPWNMATIHHCCSSPCFLPFAFMLIQNSGRLVCRWQHLESYLCPPPLSAQHTRRHVQVLIGSFAHKFPFSCTLLVCCFNIVPLSLISPSPSHKYESVQYQPPVWFR